MADKQPNSHDTARRQRLLGQIEGVRQDLERRAETAGRSPVPWKPFGEASLAKATDAADGGDDQRAWMHIHRAKRFLSESYDDDERLARARVLRAETDEKLTNWRRQAVAAVLPLDSKSPPSTGALVLAQFLLDEHFENVYFKLEMLGQRVRQLPWLLGAIVVLLLLAAWWLSADPGSSMLLPPLELLLVLLLGAAGAGVSIALSVKHLSGRIPEVLRGWTETSVRPLVGALSAVVLVVVAQSGLLPVEARGTSQLYAYSVLGGFSDQLLVRLLAAAEKAVTK